MNIENVKKLIAALESGEYTKVKEILRDCRGFCALGVAADVYIKENPTFSWRLASEPYKEDDYNYELVENSDNTPYAKSWNAFLPRPIREWYGFDKIANQDEDTYYKYAYDDLVLQINDNNNMNGFKPVIDFLKEEIAKCTKKESKN